MPGVIGGSVFARVIEELLQHESPLSSPSSSSPSFEQSSTSQAAATAHAAAKWGCDVRRARKRIEAVRTLSAVWRWDVLTCVRRDGGDTDDRNEILLSSLAEFLSSVVNSGWGRTRNDPQAAASGTTASQKKKNRDECIDTLENLPERIVVAPPPQTVSYSRRADQDRRDVERDVVKVGGVACVGANLGFEGVMRILRRELKDAYLGAVDIFPNSNHATTGSSDNNRDDAHESLLSVFAKAILTLGNRTNSGGDAYEALSAALSFGDSFLIVPDSSAPIEPVSICIDTGAFRDVDQAWKWGLRASIASLTQYKIVDASNVDDAPRARVRARYEALLGLPFALDARGLSLPKEVRTAHFPPRVCLFFN